MFQKLHVGVVFERRFVSALLPTTNQKTPQTETLGYVFCHQTCCCVFILWGCSMCSLLQGSSACVLAVLRCGVETDLTGSFWGMMAARPIELPISKCFWVNVGYLCGVT